MYITIKAHSQGSFSENSTSYITFTMLLQNISSLSWDNPSEVCPSNSLVLCTFNFWFPHHSTSQGMTTSLFVSSSFLSPFYSAELPSCQSSMSTDLHFLLLTPHWPHSSHNWSLLRPSFVVHAPHVKLGSLTTHTLGISSSLASGAFCEGCWLFLLYILFPAVWFLLLPHVTPYWSLCSSQNLLRSAAWLLTL